MGIDVPVGQIHLTVVGDPLYHKGAMSHEREAERVHRQILRGMSPAQRYSQLMMLRQTAWELKAAAIREKCPELPDAEVQIRVAKIFIHATT